MQTKSSPAGSAAAGAAEILHYVFGNLEYGLNIRMWDGSALAVGRATMPVTITFGSLAAFKRVLLHPQADAFAEAYCDGEIDLDGDLFEAMKVADSLDKLELGTFEKLKLGLRIWRLSE